MRPHGGLKCLCKSLVRPRPVCLSVCLSLSLSLSLSRFLSLCLSVCVSLSLSLFLSFSFSLILFHYLFLSLSLSLILFHYLFLSLSLSLSFSLAGIHTLTMATMRTLSHTLSSEGSFQIVGGFSASLCLTETFFLSN